MVLLVSYPTYSNDSGNGQSGTAIDQTWLDAQRASIEDQVHSTTNPTVKPKTITDEVITARGNKASLNLRIAGVIDADGALVAQASLVTQAVAGKITTQNCVPNADLLLWSQGDAAAPDYFALSGSGAAIARTGSGLSDTQSMGYGDFAAKITYGSAAAKLTHALLNAAAFGRFTGAKGRKVVIACKAKSSIASHASIVADDGATQTRGGQAGNATYHTGGGATEWLYCVHTISQSATKLEFYAEVAAAGAAYFGDFLAVFSEIAPPDFIPCAMQEGTYHFGQSGNLTTGTAKSEFQPGAPGIVMWVQLRAKTAPTTQAAIIDVNTWDGAAMTSMFSTRPQIAAAASFGGAAPDGTYARRCFKPFWGASILTGGLITIDTDQVGSGTTGADLTIEVRVRQYVRQLAAFLDYNQL